jgi:hypothetical protein
VRRTGIGATAIAVLCAVGMLVPPAALSRNTVRIADFRVEATNGYRASIEAFKRIHPRRQAKISVFLNDREGFAGSGYSTHGRFTKRRITARLGEFGRINLHFGHRRRAATSQASKAPQSRGEAGASSKVRFCIIGLSGSRRAVHGRIRFRGEDGFARIHANAARGFVGEGDVTCSGGRSIPGTVLTAKSGSLRFDAATYSRDPGPYLYASEHQTVGRVHIWRAAGSFDAGDVFTFDSALTSAHVDPVGAPFAGSADFAAPDQWTGDLSVSFPGAPDVPLTGPDFTARLRHVGR